MRILTLPTFESESVIGRKAKPIKIRQGAIDHEVVNVVSRERIHDRIHAFGHRVLDPILKDADTTFVPILSGAMTFYADVSRMAAEDAHVELMPVLARSYGKDRVPGSVFVGKESIQPDMIHGRNVVVFDDVLDTGRTVSEVVKVLEPFDPKRIVTVFLLRKKHPYTIDIVPNYWLFEVHSESWVFGYGMDLAGRFRHLRYVADANRELYDRDGRPMY